MAKAAEEPAEEPVIEEPAAEEPAVQTAETADVPNLKRFKKAELIEYAQDHGIELDPKATNAAMIETIMEALA